MSADGSITDLSEAVAALGALPMPAGPAPIGPQMPPFPPAPRTFEEKLRADVARLQGLLAEAVADKHRALRERDLMRERVSEPFGCALCGVEKRSHGRRYIGGAGMHAWERPSDEQVKGRMLARRAARFTSYPERLATLLVARTEDLLAAEARVAELEAERDRLRQLPDLPVDKLAKALLLMETGPALPWAHAMPDDDLHGFLDGLVSAALNRWRHDPEVPDRVTLADIERVCREWRTPGEGYRSDPEPDVPCPVDGPLSGSDAPEMRALRAALYGVPDGEHYAVVHHSYRVSHDLPETGGAGRG